jgi:hypothetical protein
MAPSVELSEHSCDPIAPAVPAHLRVFLGLPLRPKLRLPFRAPLRFPLSPPLRIPLRFPLRLLLRFPLRLDLKTALRVGLFRVFGVALFPASDYAVFRRKPQRIFGCDLGSEYGFVPANSSPLRIVSPEFEFRISFRNPKSRTQNPESLARHALFLLGLAAWSLGLFGLG